MGSYAARLSLGRTTMKKNKSLLALTLTLTTFGQANAANTTTVKALDTNIEITPYARVVAGLEQVNNSFDAGVTGNRTQAEFNQWGISYFGMNAKVELTNGWSALANLESGFGTNTGELSTPDTLFDRASNAGLQHDNYGQLTIGTHLVMNQDIADIDPMTLQLYGINTLVNGANEGTAENSVLYRSPDWNGFSVGLMREFGAISGYSDRSSGTGISLAYHSNDLTIRAIHQSRKDEFGRHSGGKYYGMGSFSQWIYVKTYTLGAAYDFGDLKAYVGYEYVEAPESGFTIQGTTDDEASMAWLGVNYQLTEKTELLAAWYGNKMDYSQKESDLITLGVNYYWTPAVTVYATFGYVSNNEAPDELTNTVGNNSHALNYQEQACSAIDDCNGSSQTGAYFGITINL